MRAILASSLVLLAACPDRPVAKVDPVQVGETQKDIPVSVDVDLLFVIDNSQSTTDKQTVFAQNFPNFVQALDAFPTGRPNLHIGVVTSTVDLGTNAFGGCPHPDTANNGLLQNASHDSLPPPTGRFLVDVAQPGGGRMTNYSGTLEQALSSIATVGATGCGFESPLEGMKRALDGSRPENAGFLRPGALLAVVFLTDEDDCSAKDDALFALTGTAGGDGDMRCAMYGYQCDSAIVGKADGMTRSYTSCKAREDSYLQPPAFYAQFLSTLKPPGKAIVALIGGPTTSNIMAGPVQIEGSATIPLGVEPTCHATINGHMAIGRPALRIEDFVDRFADHGLVDTICQSDYRATLEKIGQVIGVAASPCIEGAIDDADRDPNNPGLQLDCTVSDIVGGNPDGTGELETPIPACAMSDDHTPAAGGARPCWWIEHDATACATTPTGFELRLERAGVVPAEGTSTRVRCATAN